MMIHMQACMHECIHAHRKGIKCSWSADFGFKLDISSNNNETLYAHEKGLNDEQHKIYRESETRNHREREWKRNACIVCMYVCMIHKIIN